MAPGKPEKDAAEKKKPNATQDRAIKKKDTTKSASSAEKLVRDASEKIKDDEMAGRRDRVKVQKTLVESLEEKLAKNPDDEKVQADLKDAQEALEAEETVLKNHSMDYGTGADQPDSDDLVPVERQSSPDAEEQAQDSSEPGSSLSNPQAVEDEDAGPEVVSKGEKVAKNVTIKSEQPSSEMESDYDENADPPMFTRAGTRRDIDGDAGTLVGWAYRPDVEIVRKGPPNAPIYEWHSGTVDESEKTEALNIRQHRRGDEKHNGQWVWKRDQVRGMLGICWNKRGVFDPDDPFGLDLIDIEKLPEDEALPSTLIQTVWSDGVKTWETRTSFRRLWSSNPRRTDEQILANACYLVHRHNEWKSGKREALNRSPTPAEFLRRSATPKPASSSQIKSEAAQMKLSNGVANNKSVVQPTSQEKATGGSEVPSLAEYMSVMKDALPDLGSPEGLARLRISYEVYVKMLTEQKA